jgi:hypothetical protein
MYEYHRFRGLWRVFKRVGNVSDPVSDHLTKESARKETYRLNGWQYKPQKNNA